MIYTPNARRERQERGQSFIVMLVIVLPLLLLVFAVTYDLGNVAVGVTAAQNAADLAAHEAAKMVDVDHFAGGAEEVRLRPEAGTVAQIVADDMTGGAFRVDAVYVEGQMVIVEGHLTTRTPFLHTFLGEDFESITRRVRGAYRAEYGINE